MHANFSFTSGRVEASIRIGSEAPRHAVNNFYTSSVADQLAAYAEVYGK